MTKKKQESDKKSQFRRALDIPGMGNFNHDRIDMDDILDTDVLILSGKVVKGRQGEFAIFDIELSDETTKTVICGGENVVRLMRKWENTGNSEPIIAMFGKAETDSGFDVYTIK